MGNFRIVDVKQTLNNEQEKHVYKLQKKNIFGVWKDIKHNLFDVLDGKVTYVKNAGKYFDSREQAVSYLAELKEYNGFKKRHFYKNPSYVFAAYNGPKEKFGKPVKDVSYVPLDMFDGWITEKKFLYGEYGINCKDVMHSKQELIQQMNYLLGNKVAEENYLYLYPENIHADGTAGWTII